MVIIIGDLLNIQSKRAYFIRHMKMNVKFNNRIVDKVNEICGHMNEQNDDIVYIFDVLMDIKQRHNTETVTDVRIALHKVINLMHEEGMPPKVISDLLKVDVDCLVGTILKGRHRSE